MMKRLNSAHKKSSPKESLSSSKPHNHQTSFNFQGKPLQKTILNSKPGVFAKSRSP